MKRKSLHNIMLASLLLGPVAGTFAADPALAQPAQPRWRPRVEAIIVRAAPSKDWHIALSSSHLGKAFMVSASIPVPYSDLDLSRQPDADEMDRRIQIAARLVCQELDNKYPPTQFPLIEGYSGIECARQAARDGRSQITTILASAQH